jgi:hypothetical protein
MSEGRRLLQVGVEAETEGSLTNRVLLPLASLQRGDEESTAVLTLTWDRVGSQTVEAVVVDGVFDSCSVDNSVWREMGSSSIKRVDSTCTGSCTEKVTGMDTGIEGVDRQCVQMTLVLGSVYDVLISSGTEVRALRVRAPWVHTAGSCVVSDATANVCGGPDITWHGGLLSMGGPAQVGTIGQELVNLNSSTPEGVKIVGVDKFSKHLAYGTTVTRPSSDMADMIHLSIDRGMRITRIVTANTFSIQAMEKLSKATSREDILRICVRDHADQCVLTEHMTLPASLDGVHQGWSFEPQHGSPVRAKSGVPGSVLWVADLKRMADCRVSVGSWLLGSMPLNTEGDLGVLFSESLSRLCGDAQAAVLVRPGYAWPDLVSGRKKVEWSITFLEIQELDELGVPTRRV